MRWDNPALLVFLALLPLAAVVSLFMERRRALYLKNMIRPGGVLLFSFRAAALKIILLVAAIGFALAALAAPRWGRVWQEVERAGRDVVFLIDTSASMLAGDIEPDRLSAARTKVSFMVENLQAARMGLVFFAGTAFVHCPVTFDTGAVRLFMQEAWDSLIPLPGSDFEKALLTAAEAFPGTRRAAGRTIVFVTDGEELQGSAEKALDKLNDMNIKVAVLALGTREGAPIPVYRESGQLAGYKTDRQGNTVISRLDENLMRSIAGRAGGIYVPAARGMSDALRIISFIEEDEKTEKSDKIMAALEHRYQYPLAVSLLLLLTGFMISGRREP